MRGWLLACAALAWSWGCASDVEDIHDPDGDDPPSEPARGAVMRERWHPPPSTIRGRYDEAGAWNDGRACAGGVLRGTKAIGERIRSAFTIDRVEGYECRPRSTDASELSIHATGRAIDIFAEPGAGDQVAKWLVVNAEELGVQLVVWNRTIWKITPAGPTSRAYAGPNPHTTHVHVELTREAAAR